MLKSNGDGSRTISKQTQITLGVVLILVLALVGFVSYAAAQDQVLTSHVVDTNIHWSKTALDDSFMPRGEIDAKFGEVQRSLARIEKRLGRD